MPWTASEFASRHNHSLHGGKATHAAGIANAVLRSGVPEGESIAIANKWAKQHRAAGGAYNPDKPQISREDDAQILSQGRKQSPNTDLNLTPSPGIRSPYGTIPSQPDPSWLPGPIPNDVMPPARSRFRHTAAGGGITGYDDGGAIGSGIGGIAPSAQTMNPVVQNAVQRYASLPTEKLAELVARLGGTQQGQMAQKVLQQKRMMPPPPTAQQVPGDSPAAPGGQPQGLKRGGAMKRASGGDMGISPSQGSPWWTRAEARGSDSGFLHGTTPGRADSILTQAPGGAYVVPADVVAGLGEGNSLAGARIADAMFSTGPHGISMPRGGRGAGPPHPPPAFREQAKKGGAIKVFRSGGKTDGATPVALSDGEYVISPKYCEALGHDEKNPDEEPEHKRKRAHRILDKWVLAQRKKIIEKTKKLPGPVVT